MVFTILDAFVVERRLDALKIRRQEREVIERRYIRRRSTADRVLPRHQMHYRNVATVEPVTGEVEIRTEAYPEAEYVPVEITSRLEDAA